MVEEDHHDRREHEKENRLIERFLKRASTNDFRGMRQFLLHECHNHCFELHCKQALEIALYHYETDKDYQEIAQLLLDTIIDRELGHTLPKRTFLKRYEDSIIELGYSVDTE